MVSEGGGGGEGEEGAVMVGVDGVWEGRGAGV